MKRQRYENKRFENLYLLGKSDNDSFGVIGIGPDAGSSKTHLLAAGDGWLPPNRRRSLESSQPEVSRRGCAENQYQEQPSKLY